MGEHEATLTARAKFTLPPDRKWTSKYLRRLRDDAAMTVYCTLPHKDGKDWSFTGTAKQALSAQRKHRWNHKSHRRRPH